MLDSLIKADYFCFSCKSAVVDYISEGDSESVPVHRHFRGRGAGISVAAARAGVAVAKIFSAAQAGRAEKCDLRMWRRIRRRSPNSVPVAVLSLRDHLFDLRRGSDFSGSVCGRVHWVAGRRVHRDSGVSAFVD